MTAMTKSKRSELTPISESEMDSMSIAEMAEFARSKLSDGVFNFIEAGRVILRIEQHPEGGDVLRELKRMPIARMARMVAANILVPEAFKVFYQNEQAAKAISLLPLDEQRRLADEGKVEVVEIINGETTMRLKDIVSLNKAEIDRVFNADERRLCKKEEQAATIGRLSTEASIKARPIVDIDVETETFNLVKHATFEQANAVLKRKGYRLKLIAI